MTAFPGARGRAPGLPRAHLRILVVLATTQTLGWGALLFLPVLAPAIAADLGMSLTHVYAGTSLLFAAMALASPAAGRLFLRIGTRAAMTWGAVLCGLALAGVAAAPGALALDLAWIVCGLGAAAFLATAPHVFLADVAGPRAARGLIGALMLATGLSTAIIYPLTHWLQLAFGWRGAVACLALLCALPLPLLTRALLPDARPAPRAPADPAAAPPPSFYRSPVFLLLLATLSLNSFASFGAETMGLELFRSLGAAPDVALAAASAMALFKIGGRAVDILGGGRWDGLTTGLVSAVMMPAGLLALGLLGASAWGIGLFLALFATGAGAFAVSRATMALVFYEGADFARASAAISLPRNLCNALAPPLLAAVLTGTGPAAMLWILGLISLAALGLILLLTRHRPV